MIYSKKLKNKGGDFYVSGSDFGFPDVKVKTSISYVEDGFNLLREMDKSEIFNILIINGVSSHFFSSAL